MNGMITKLGEQNVTEDHRFFARAWPTGQTKQRAPVTFVHDPVTDEIVILAMIEHGQTDHARVFDGAPHQFIILNAMSVIRDCGHAGLGK